MNCSWFFRGLCHIDKAINPSIWLNYVNPSNISFLFDPWYFEIPLAFKLTYLNMDLDLNSMQISDLVYDVHRVIHAFQQVFGEHLNNEMLAHGKIDMERTNHWVWFPKAHCVRIPSKIYSHLNSNAAHCENWCGWDKLWRLKVAPRIKHFMWLMFKGKIKTYNYLHSLNLGPHSLCIMWPSE